MNLACQACKKQSATVHLTDITPQGEKRERHLCEECAQREGVTPPPQPQPLSHMLASLVGGNKAAAQQLADLKCPQCGLTFVEFRNNGLLGCPHDYDAFERALMPLIERAHQGSSHHIGKSPRRKPTGRALENDLILLRRRLNRAVDAEQFEEAARLRDQLKSMENRG